MNVRTERHLLGTLLVPLDMSPTVAAAPPQVPSRIKPFPGGHDIGAHPPDPHSHTDRLDPPLLPAPPEKSQIVRIRDKISQISIAPSI